MDAEMFVRETNRMIEYATIRGESYYDIALIGKTNPAEAVRIVEEWSKAHPTQTRKDKFKEVFGFYPYAINERTDETIWVLSLNTESWWDAPYEAPNYEE